MDDRNERGSWRDGSTTSWRYKRDDAQHQRSCGFNQKQTKMKTSCDKLTVKQWLMEEKWGRETVHVHKMSALYDLDISQHWWQSWQLSRNPFRITYATSLAHTNRGVIKYLPGYSKFGNFSSWQTFCCLSNVWTFSTVIKLSNLQSPTQNTITGSQHNHMQET